MKTINEKIDECYKQAEIIPTYEELHELGGEAVETADDGCVELWVLNGKEYVVLCDNSVMTREEDNSFREGAYFPY